MRNTVGANGYGFYQNNEVLPNPRNSDLS